MSYTKTFMHNINASYYSYLLYTQFRIYAVLNYMRDDEEGCLGECRRGDKGWW